MSEDTLDRDWLVEDEGGDEVEAPAERSGAVGEAEFRGLRRRKGRQLARPEELPPRTYAPEERLLLLDTWRRSGLPAKDFSALVGVNKHTLYAWKKRFEQHGPAGLMDKVKGAPSGSRVDEVTRRSILMLKESNPEYGCERISLMLLRGPGLGASASTVARVLKEEGYEFVEEATRPNPPKVRRFERSVANELWQTDLFTFTLKRQNRRVHLVAFMDDYSRFVVGYGLYSTASAKLVLEVLRSALNRWGAPQEILTDNGTQYVTWRGKTEFTKELEKRGVKHVVAKPKRPQTLGKVERFWGTLWRECAETAVFYDLDDARKRIGLFIDHYNFQRPHQGIDGLVPADRFFGAEAEVARTLKERVAANALALARGGLPKRPFYMTGQAGGKSFSVFAEGERVFLRRDEGEREEVDLAAPDGAAGLPEEVVREARAWRATAVVTPQEPDELPESVVPEGHPASQDEYEPGNEDVPGPGASLLDDQLDRLAGGDA